MKRVVSRYVLYPYKVESESAHRLKDALKEAGKNAIIVYPDRKYSCEAGDLIIGWGCSKTPNWQASISKAAGVLNRWDRVEQSIDKAAAFNCFKAAGVSMPEITASAVRAAQWLGKGSIIIARTRLRGMKGQGIVVLTPDKEYDNLGQDFKLYSKFVPNTKEYRVYVLKGQVIDVLEKRRENGSHDPGFVRTEENGWVFCRNLVNLPKLCADEAIKATDALKLDFAGVDVLWAVNEHKAYVLETNTCPDVFGSGIRIFRDQFIQLGEKL